MEQEDGHWTYERLFTYLQDPRGEVPGTKMGFRGVRDEGDLAALIAWMRLQADQPEPLEGAE
jgi:cytochrome c